MKRNILIAALCLVAATGLQAQVLIQQNGERVNFSDNKLVKIVFDSYSREHNGEDILFVYESGDTATFDIDAVYVMGFAEDFTHIDEVKEQGEAAIVYDAATATVHIVNAEEEGVIRLYNAEGRQVKKAAGHTLALPELGAGLYVVSYNEKLNAKIVKK